MMTEPEQQTLAVGKKAFGYFTQGLETGEWEPFLAMLTDDFSFWFPVSKFHGLNQGKERAREFFEYVASAYSDGLTVMLDRVMSNETTVVFEFRDEGLMWGNDYKNRVAVSFDVRGDKICFYREYFGSDGKSY